MPYAHKYANSVGEVGALETIKRFAPGGVVETLIKGAFSAMTQDIEKLMEILVDAEMKRFDDARKHYEAALQIRPQFEPALLDLCDNPAHRAGLAEAGEWTASVRFDATLMARQMEDLYRSVLGR